MTIMPDMPKPRLTPTRADRTLLNVLEFLSAIYSMPLLLMGMLAWFGKIRVARPDMTPTIIILGFTLCTMSEIIGRWPRAAKDWRGN